MKPSDEAALIDIEGRFYRAVDRTYLDDPISGSRGAGRYSPPDRPTLYLSASQDGVAAAMKAHSGDAAAERVVIALDVSASGIFDLRDTAACAALGVSPADATAPWQYLAAEGGHPSSWTLRERVEAAGANGLIDPSRTAPGLWHLVLFRWNAPGAPNVRRAGAHG
jgi:RES domain-containing protein